MKTPSEPLTVPLAAVAALAVEYWRLSAAIPAPSAPARHALRKIGDFLAGCDIEIRSLDGLAYDPGLAAKVIDTVHDATLARGSAVIDETVCPLILYRGQVVQPAEIVVRSSPE